MRLAELVARWWPRRGAARRLLPLVWLPLVAAACARLPEPSVVPVMGLGKQSTAADSAALAAAAGPAAVAVAAVDSADALRQRLLFLPFEDTSEYEGPWNVPFEMPTTLAAALSGNTFLRPVLLDSAQAAALGRHEREGRIALSRGLELAHATGADYVVFGQVETLAMERFRATVPAGGYRSYEGRTRVTLRPVKVIDQQPTAVVTREGVEATKQYGITNPAAFVPYEKEYFELSQMAWGSAAFQQTLLGKSVGTCVTSLAAALDSLISPPPQLRALTPMIIDVQGAQAYINVGLADSVGNGDKFGVWDKGRVLTDPNTGLVLGRALARRVGVVQVEQVLSEHLSVVRILEGADQVRSEFDIRAE